MSKFKSKEELLNEIMKERTLLEELLAVIPDSQKTVAVVDGMSVKDFLAHRTEWGEMMNSWYAEAKAGKQPAVPTKKYKWNQLKELNADIHERHKNDSLKKVTTDFKRVHNALFKLISQMSEEELFSKKYYEFTGVSDLATYVNSSTASHYRSARRHIAKWWRQQS